ncbi:MAG: dephospho-CoA kinase [Alloprevotella sp.]|nr:dephospho-CoA kinase [Alloprevotella sp.]
MSETRHPHRLAVTGGIGSGKSHICRLLSARGLPVFYCDDEAKRLIRQDSEIRRRLTALIGPEVYDKDGRLVKPVLAAWICGSKAQAAQIDAIVHPRVAEVFDQWASDHAEAAVVVMECALLYESGFDRLVDEVVAVSVPEELRLQRVVDRDGVTTEKARAWMALQLPDAEKLCRADYVVRNDDDAHLQADLALLYTKLSLTQQDQ